MNPGIFRIFLNPEAGNQATLRGFFVSAVMCSESLADLLAGRSFESVERFVPLRPVFLKNPKENAAKTYTVYCSNKVEA